MPNHCYNSLSILDDNSNFLEVMKNYLSTDDDGNFVIDCNKVIPMPEGIATSHLLASHENHERMAKMKHTERTEYDKMLANLNESNREKYGYADWYSWCVDTWGTKWGCYDAQTDEHGSSFNTAWCPPLPVIKELAIKTGKTLEMKYYEEGCDFIGCYTANPDGTDNDECYSPIDDAPEDLRHELGLYNDEEWADETELETK